MLCKFDQRNPMLIVFIPAEIRFKKRQYYLRVFCTQKMLFQDIRTYILIILAWQCEMPVVCLCTSKTPLLSHQLYVREDCQCRILAFLWF